ncbi:MAG: GNAT family N-acetyltransferase [Sulfurimonas sp.]|uniref:GNAT family N-acetyltransferase n=1 Tax=Sulfurimonas sp. TaxID=2022749 RepID=UPI0025E06BF1|nr:GNAT family N-acetyltransferase [Sulfurimonas sp.]MCK9490878.1 GNAT family N-acetyltransferase [Sulfurimonas sp.]
MIKKAKKTDQGLSILILNAIGKVAKTLTGESEKKKILKTLDFYISMNINRLSYNNIYTYEVKNDLAGLIIAYDSNRVDELDNLMIRHLASKNIFLDSFDKECFEDEFYVDTISVFEEFQGRGIAKELFCFIEEKAKELGFTKVSLLVDVENIKALSLYEKIGYKKNTILKLSNHEYHHMIKRL